MNTAHKLSGDDLQLIHAHDLHGRIMRGQRIVEHQLVVREAESGSPLGRLPLFSRPELELYGSLYNPLFIQPRPRRKLKLGGHEAIMRLTAPARRYSGFWIILVR